MRLSHGGAARAADSVSDTGSIGFRRCRVATSEAQGLVDTRRIIVNCRHVVTRHR